MTTKALYGKDGPKLPLETHLLLEGKELDWGKWSHKPYCPACGQPVYPYDKHAALGFKAAGREVGEARAAALPGFHHFKGNGGVFCPLYHENDPRFAGLTHHQFDVRMREPIRAALYAPAIVELNRRNLARLWRGLSGRCVTGEERTRWGKTTKESLMNMEALATHPWLLPYLLMLREKVQDRQCATGNVVRATFKGEGEQKIPYTGQNNRERFVVMPKVLRVCFVNGEGVGIPFLKPMIVTPRTYFPVSEWEAYRLAGMVRPSPSGGWSQKMAGPLPKAS